MSYASINTRAQLGLNAPLVSVEVHLSNGLPCFSIVGLPELAVRESRERVRAALVNCHFKFPARRITVNLAPAELPKQGGRFDLAIAIGLLIASEQLATTILHNYEFIGELSLNGELRRSEGILPAAHHCWQQDRVLITARQNLAELTLLPTHSYLGAETLLQVCAHLTQTRTLESVQAISPQDQDQCTHQSMADVIGQTAAKRALTIAAAGHHHVLMIGSPGSGKTMLANRFQSLLQPMDTAETIETASLYSIANSHYGKHPNHIRPFRSPHHTVSPIGLAGGGAYPRPGEVSLAHNGVLFLDELTEFSRAALEILREPIETGEITISRAAGQLSFPARFQLIAAMNPCPKGCDIDQYGLCQCNEQQLRRYRNKLSAPLLDRIDIQISVPKLAPQLLLEAQHTDKQDWPQLIAQIAQARTRQMQRQHKLNALLSSQELQSVCDLNSAIRQSTQDMMQQLQLTARGLHQILKIARTIADLVDCKYIQIDHIHEAACYRKISRLLH